MVELLAYPLNTASFGKEYYDATDAQVYTCTRTSGVYSADDNLRVRINPTNPRGVQVTPGLAWLKIGDFKGIAVAMKSVQNYAINVAVDMPKIVRIKIRYSYADDKVEMVAESGDQATNPAAPPIHRDSQFYEIAIGDIFVRVGSDPINEADIIDQRLNDGVCGLMRDGVTGIPTQSLNDSFNAWFDDVKKQLGEFDAYQIQNDIAKLQNYTFNLNKMYEYVASDVKVNTTNISAIKSSSPNLDDDWTGLPLNVGYYDVGRFGVRYWIDPSNMVHLVLQIWKDSPVNNTIATLPYGIVPPYTHTFLAITGGRNSKILLTLDPYDRSIFVAGAADGAPWGDGTEIQAYTTFKTYRH